MNTPANLPETGLCSLSGCPIAMAYVPVQRFENLYCANKALVRGTLFEDLDLPFLGETVNGRGGGCNCG